VLPVTEAYGFNPNSVSTSESRDMAESKTVVTTVADENIEIQTERLEGRRCSLCATIEIPHAIEQVWQILTDYEHLADFIPNLARSRQMQHPTGGIRIEQIGTENLFRLKFCARVVLDMVEQFPHQIEFKMVEGDFKAFDGSWQLQPVLPADRVDGLVHQAATNLCYSVVVCPPRTMPIGMIERRLSSSLVINLLAIRQRADALFLAS
jgi:ribosome-associated toxin RatA of RatAB toxin-antitoxin module